MFFPLYITDTPPSSRYLDSAGMRSRGRVSRHNHQFFDNFVSAPGATIPPPTHWPDFHTVPRYPAPIPRLPGANSFVSDWRWGRGVVNLAVSPAKHLRL